MKNKLLLIVVICLLVVFKLNIHKKELKEIKKNEEANIKIKDENNNVSQLSLEDYVVGVVAAEMPASFNIEALKAQAVASRTFAVYKMEHNNSKEYDISSTINDQAYITVEQMHDKWQNDYEKYYEKVKSAVVATDNEVMVYQGNVIESFYYAMSNGYTSDAQSVFSESLPYLASVESKWDNNQNNFLVSTTIKKEDFCQKLNIDCTSINISDITRDKTNRVSSININNQTFKGTNFRTLLNLRSTDFEIEINDDNVLITTKGYGHGVGMSQYGANGMAKEGKNYQEILKYYYQNIDLTKLSV